MLNKCCFYDEQVISSATPGQYDSFNNVFVTIKNLVRSLKEMMRFDCEIINT